MVINIVEIIRKLHVIAKHRLKHIMAFAWYRELNALKIVGSQREDILQIIDVVKWYPIVAHEGFSATQSADAAKQRE